MGDSSSSRSWLLRPLHALCGRQSFSDLSILDRGATTSSSTMGSNSNIQSYRYDVFISFRGPDTRNTFVDHLYAHLIRKGIFAFKDDKLLQKGGSISPQLLQAIKHSRISIVVFSKDYAASTWCLDEMATIAECHTQLKQIVFPVFYDVDPSHVRKQNGVYENAFVSHKYQNSGKARVWRRDMTHLAGLTGWDVRNKPQFKEIEDIVLAVIKALGHKFSGFADDLIGIQPRVEALESLLNLTIEDEGFRVLGIRGMGGIGKTTLATVLYDKISHHYQFDACCLIENVSKIYTDGGVIAVQKQILRRTIKEKDLNAYSPSEISGIVRNRLHNIKLLLVLDDVDQFEQLQELHISPKLLRAGSRIIITTRDEHILKRYDVDMVYEAELMNYNDAHELLCRKAFKNDNSSSAYAELIPKVLKYAQGLPLAIRVMGSFLYDRNTTQWRATLEGLQNNPDSGIMKVLQSSFEGLELREREIFLHIACFFEGEREDYVGQILDACGLQPDIGIPVIAEKSLITIRNQEIHMHNILQELGKKNVRKEHTNEPGLWSRLWLYADFHLVMMTETRAVKVKAIVLDQREDSFKFNQLKAHDLSKLGHLELLILCHNNFSGRLEFLSNALRYFSWSGYPFASLPSNFQPQNLVELNMSDSSIEQLWIGIQYLPNLKRMDLSNSKNLKMTPRFDGMQNLEQLDLTGCTNLSEVHPSIGLLTKLVFFSLQNCSSLVSLNFGSESRLSSLRVLRLFGCTKLEKTPDFIGALLLEYLDMDRCTGLSTIDESIGALAKLRFLSLRDCTNLVTMADSFNDMKSLVTLDLCGCLNFTNLPVNSPLESLIFLDLSFCNISKVPDAIGELWFLERLNLQGNNFTTIPSTIKGLSNLAYLNLSHCHRLHDLPDLQPESGPSNSVGEYFRTTPGSRDHRSGLYVFDCPEMASFSFESFVIYIQFVWLERLVTEPRLFRCGFDFVLPWHGNNIDFQQNHTIPKWFDHQFNGGSVITINQSEMPLKWVGFVFCVEFEVNNPSAVSGSPHHSLSLPLPHPFYLSFESEHTEECFDMPLNLELNKIDGSNYLWIIYISWQHCHFVNTGAQITFNARHGLIVNKWGFRMVTKKDIEGPKITKITKKWLKGMPPMELMEDIAVSAQRKRLPLEVVIDNLEESSSNVEPKIQLPYNWLVSDEDEIENNNAKSKESNLSNLGLFRRWFGGLTH